MQNGWQHLSDLSSQWPSVSANIEFSGEDSGIDEKRRARFLEEMRIFFERLEEKFGRLAEEERRECGLRGIGTDISLKVDMSKKEVILDKIYKHCRIEVHLFKELSEILQRHFPDFALVVPTLEGYELAREIYHYLGEPSIECIYLKGQYQDKLLLGKRLKGITFLSILTATERHYAEGMGIDGKKRELGLDADISMYLAGKGYEEEIVWMQVRVGLGTPSQEG